MAVKLIVSEIKVKDVGYEEGMTVKTALDKIGITLNNPKNFTIKVNKKSAELATPVNDNDIITVTGRGKNG